MFLLQRVTSRRLRLSRQLQQGQKKNIHAKLRCDKAARKKKRKEREQAHRAAILCLAMYSYGLDSGKAEQLRSRGRGGRAGPYLLLCESQRFEEKEGQIRPWPTPSVSSKSAERCCKTEVHAFVAFVVLAQQKCLRGTRGGLCEPEQGASCSCPFINHVEVKIANGEYNCICKSK
jgi:hypothetical protein